jgi:hypothetical protein
VFPSISGNTSSTSQMFFPSHSPGLLAKHSKLFCRRWILLLGSLSTGTKHSYLSPSLIHRPPSSWKHTRNHSIKWHKHQSLSEWLRIHTGHIGIRIVKEPCGSLQKVPSGYFGGHFSKEPTTYLLGNNWANCFRAHKELTMDQLLMFCFSQSCDFIM